jgi:hypothetical protein
MQAQQCINKVKNRGVYDPVFPFQLSNDFHVRNLLDDYWPGGINSAAMPYFWSYPVR